MHKDSFVILTPDYVRDYRQEYFILNHHKERAYMVMLLIGLLMFTYGIM